MIFSPLLIFFFFLSFFLSFFLDFFLDYFLLLVFHVPDSVFRDKDITLFGSELAPFQPRI